MMWAGSICPWPGEPTLTTTMGCIKAYILYTAAPPSDCYMNSLMQLCCCVLLLCELLVGSVFVCVCRSVCVCVGEKILSMSNALNNCWCKCKSRIKYACVAWRFVDFLKQPTNCCSVSPITVSLFTSRCRCPFYPWCAYYGPTLCCWKNHKKTWVLQCKKSYLSI